MLQAEQLRKCAYVSAPGQDYDPEKDRTCTIYAGTMVQQVNTTCALLLCTTDMISLVPSYSWSRPNKVMVFCMLIACQVC